MDIQYAILGLLSWQPFSGYDLKKIIAESELFYWSGNNNQIYNCLIALHKEGQVTQEVRYQESLPAKKVYSLTETGRERLRSWLQSSPELPELHGLVLAAAQGGRLDDLRRLPQRRAEPVRERGIRGPQNSHRSICAMLRGPL